MQKRLALITGATAGIGRATALELSKNGFDLILAGRREDRLQAVASEIGMHCKVRTLSFDVGNRIECERALASLGEDLKRIDTLINNAGLARGVDPMPSAEISDWEEMIETNVLGLLYMTRLILPGMVAAKKGDILNIGSVAGRWTYPGGGVYCASKAAVRAITEGLRLDLAGTGIRVTNLAPGMVETEFSEVRLGDKSKAQKVYEGMTPLSAHDIAETIRWCLSRPAHVNVQEMLIFPTAQAGVGFVHR